MRTLRAIYRLIAFLVITLFYFSVIISGNLISTFGATNKYDWSARMKQKWGRAICRLMAIRVSVKGNAPEPPFFMASNHLSYIDVWVLFSVLRCTFIAKSEVKSWPLVGTMLSKSGILFVDRNRRSDVARVNEEISRNMNQYQGIVLFPEGTTSPGVQILPFKSSLFQYPAEFSLPVSCTSLRYETSENELPAFKHICWWDDTPFFAHLFNVLKMKEFSATVTFSQTKITGTNRKQLAHSAEVLIQQSFEPVIQPDLYAEANFSS